MTGIRRWVLYFLGWLALAAAVQGQELPSHMADEDLPPPPPLGVSDRAGLFSRNPEGLQRISETIGKLEADHGFRFYLVLEPVMISGSPQQLAARLQQAWLPDGDGFVVVFEVESRSVGLGRGMEGGNDLGADRRVPSYEMVSLLSNMLDVTDPEQPAEVYVESMVAALVKELDGYFARRKAPGSRGRSLRFGLIAAGTLAILALAALGMAWLLRRSEAESRRSFRFPEVEVPERLGAPSGGGDVTSRRFGSGGGDAPR